MRLTPSRNSRRANASPAPNAGDADLVKLFLGRGPAGSSDWVVFAGPDGYPADEAYFLRFSLHFFEETLTNHPDLDAAAFADWLAQRHAQIDAAELVYIAHQLDFFGKVI